MTTVQLRIWLLESPLNDLHKLVFGEIIAQAHNRLLAPSRRVYDERNQLKAEIHSFLKGETL